MDLDMNKIMEMANQLKSQLEKTQADTMNLTARGEAGGGMVAVTMNGRFEVLEVKIEPSAMADMKLLEDLVRAACNAAVANLQAAAKDKMGLLAHNMGLGPLGTL
jgi:DNA-binding YbaB/EbfC family protein